MAQEILPEVKQKEQQEAARKEEERKALAQQLAVGPLLPAPMSSSELRMCLLSSWQWHPCCHNGAPGSGQFEMLCALSSCWR